MIKTESLNTKFQAQFTNGIQLSIADATPDKGGTGQGFRPHELLEAALATCMNMSLRMYAEKHVLPLAGVSVSVALDRSKPNEPTFEYQVDVDGPLTESDKMRLLQALENCPVRTTLSRPLRFRAREPKCIGPDSARA